MKNLVKWMAVLTIVTPVIPAYAKSEFLVRESLLTLSGQESENLSDISEDFSEIGQNPQNTESEASLEELPNPVSYDGIVSDEMIEAWEKAQQENSSLLLTEIYDNDIEWDIKGSGDEDNAGNEQEIDFMDGPTYSAEEQDKILEKIQETTATVEKGYLHITCDFGETWPGYNVTIALYNANQKRLEFTVYSQNGYELRELVPAGTYRVYRAYVPGDENGSSYPLVMSESHVTVAEQTTADIVIMKAAEIEKEDSQRYQQAKEDRTEKRIALFLQILL